MEMEEEREVNFFDNLGPSIRKLRRYKDESLSEFELETLLQNLESPLEQMSRVQLGWKQGSSVQSKHGLGKGTIAVLFEALLWLHRIQEKKRTQSNRLMHLACIILGNLCEIPELLQLLLRCLFFKEATKEFAAYRPFVDTESEDPRIVEIILDQLPGYAQAEEQALLSQSSPGKSPQLSLDPLDWAGKEPYLRLLSSLVASEPGCLSVQQYIALQTPLLLVLMKIEVEGSSTGLLTLDLFAWCCEASVHFRQAVKSLPSSQRKRCYRRLLSFLDSHHQPEVMVRSLLALLALLSGDSFETKVFDPVNIEQAATLVFRQVLGYGSLPLQRLCVRILRKLLLLPSAGPHLYTSGYLVDFIDRALNTLADRARPGGSEGLCPPECVYAGLQTAVELAVNARRTVYQHLREGELQTAYWDGIIAGITHPHSPTATASCAFLAMLFRSASIQVFPKNSVTLTNSMAEDYGNWLWSALMENTEPLKSTGHSADFITSLGPHDEVMDVSGNGGAFTTRQKAENNGETIIISLVLSKLNSISKVIGFYGKVGREAPKIGQENFTGGPLPLEGEAVQKEPEVAALLDLLCSLSLGPPPLLHQLQANLNFDHLANIIQAQIVGLDGLEPLHYPCPPMEIIIRGMVLLVHLSGNLADPLSESQDIQEDSAWARRALASLLGRPVVMETLGSALWQAEARELTTLAIELLGHLQTRGGAESLAATDAIYKFSQKYLSKFFEMAKRLEYLEDRNSKMESELFKKNNEASEKQYLANELAETHARLISKMRAKHTEEIVKLREKLDSKCEGLAQQIQDLSRQLTEAQASSDRYKHMAKELQREQKQRELEKASGDAESGRLKRMLTDTKVQLEEKEHQLQMIHRKRKDTLQRCETAETRNTEIQSDVVRLRRKIDDCTAEIDKLTGERDILSTAKADLEDKIEDTYSKLISLAKSYKAKEEENEDLHRKVTKLEQQLKIDVEDADSRQERILREKKRLDQVLQETEAAHQRLQKTTEKLQQKYDSRESDLEKLQQTVSSQGTQIRLLKKESTKKDDELEDLREQLREMRHKYNIKSAEYDNAQKELDRQQGIIGYINKLSGHDEDHIPSKLL